MHLQHLQVVIRLSAAGELSSSQIKLLTVFDIFHRFGKQIINNKH